MCEASGQCLSSPFLAEMSEVQTNQSHGSDDENQQDVPGEVFEKAALAAESKPRMTAL